MLKVLITGAGGFTGRYLAARLAAAGHSVFGMFVEPPGELPAGIESAVVCDLVDRTGVAAMLHKVQPDLVAHLAGIAFVQHGDVDTIYQTNLLGTRHLLEAIAMMARPPRMTLLASSANVYGNSDAELLDESTPPAPANDYAVSKLAMEHVARLYMDRLALVIARPFNYTGVGQDKAFLLPKIVDHVHRRAQVIELGNLDVARDFSDVRTVVQYYHRLLECPQAAGGTFNVCSGQAHSLREILELIRELSGHEFNVQVNPAFMRANEVKVLRGSRARLDQLVGSVDNIPLRDTLRWMLEAPAS